MTTSSDISNLSAADLTAAHIALLVASYGRPSDSASRPAAACHQVVQARQGQGS